MIIRPPDTRAHNRVGISNGRRVSMTDRVLAFRGIFHLTPVAFRPLCHRKTAYLSTPRARPVFRSGPGERLIGQSRPFVTESYLPICRPSFRVICSTPTDVLCEIISIRRSRVLKGPEIFGAVREASCPDMTAGFPGVGEPRSSNSRANGVRERYR